MPDHSTDRALAAAALGLLWSEPRLTVWPNPAGQTPDMPNPPYVRVYCTTEWPRDDPSTSIAALSIVAVTRWWCHSVGSTTEAAGVVAALVRAALTDQRPTVTGRSCSRIVQEIGDRPPGRDTSTGMELATITAVYRMDSTG